MAPQIFAFIVSYPSFSFSEKRKVIRDANTTFFASSTSSRRRILPVLPRLAKVAK